MAVARKLRALFDWFWAGFAGGRWCEIDARSLLTDLAAGWERGLKTAQDASKVIRYSVGWKEHVKMVCYMNKKVLHFAGYIFYNQIHSNNKTEHCSRAQQKRLERMFAVPWW